jgi:ubiquinone/menaquinone biosynthesis C-methylase UbiE
MTKLGKRFHAGGWLKLCGDDLTISVEFASKELSAKYDRFARWYDHVEGVLDLLGLRTLRRSVLSEASGKVLEVAVGTGKNLCYYPQGCRIIAVDVSAAMLNHARTTKLSLNASFLLADAEALPFSDKNFDTVVSSLTTCTFPNPVAALREMARVCRTDGKIFLLEHGRSNRGWLARFQDRHADQVAKPLGCHWNGEPRELAREAVSRSLSGRRFFYGIFHVIEATP